MKKILSIISLFVFSFTIFQPMVSVLAEDETPAEQESSWEASDDGASFEDIENNEEDNGLNNSNEEIWWEDEENNKVNQEWTWEWEEIDNWWEEKQELQEDNKEEEKNGNNEEVKDDIPQIWEEIINNNEEVKEDIKEDIKEEVWDLSWGIIDETISVEKSEKVMLKMAAPKMLLGAPAVSSTGCEENYEKDENWDCVQVKKIIYCDIWALPKYTEAVTGFFEQVLSWGSWFPEETSVNWATTWDFCTYKCKENYTLLRNWRCKASTQRVACTTPFAMENAEVVTGMFTQTWDWEKWTPETNTTWTTKWSNCVYKCKTWYVLNSDWACRLPACKFSWTDLTIAMDALFSWSQSLFNSFSWDMKVSLSSGTVVATSFLNNSSAFFEELSWLEVKAFVFGWEKIDLLQENYNLIMAKLIQSFSWFTTMWDRVYLPLSFLAWDEKCSPYYPGSYSVEVRMEVPLYKITFDSKKWSAVKEQVIFSWELVSQPADPTRSWRKFIWWYSDSAYTQWFDFSSYITGDITLYAKWETVKSEKSSSSSDSTTTTNTNTWTTTTWAVVSTWNIVETVTTEVLPKYDCSIEGSYYSKEENNAYLWACQNWLISEKNIMDVDWEGALTRWVLAKYLSIYAQDLLWKKKVTSEIPHYPDVDSELWELVNYINDVYQLHIMGVKNGSVQTMWFRPNDGVTKWEFATVFSRMLFGSKYDNNSSEYFLGHFNKLFSLGIIKDMENPYSGVSNGEALVMLYRSLKVVDGISEIETPKPLVDSFHKQQNVWEVAAENNDAHCSLKGSKYSKEENEAFLWACSNWITSSDSIMGARFDDVLTRWAFAKMVVIFAQDILGKQPIFTWDFVYWDVDESLGDRYNYISLIWKLWLMWVRPDWTPTRNFRPTDQITREEFATVFYRLLFDEVGTGKVAEKWTFTINKLYTSWILSVLDSDLGEVRSWMFVMLYRAHQLKWWKAINLKITWANKEEINRKEENIWEVKEEKNNNDWNNWDGNEVKNEALLIIEQIEKNKNNSNSKTTTNTTNTSNVKTNDTTTNTKVSNEKVVSDTNVGTWANTVKNEALSIIEQIEKNKK